MAVLSGPAAAATRLAVVAAAATAFGLLLAPVSAQTFSNCNPLKTDCTPNSALGMAVDIDFRKGAVNSFVASGSPAYGSDGVSFSVARGGDAPQLNSLFYIMFGRVELTMKAAPGAGIVSSLVLESDDLDEIDIEWLGSNPDEIQSNYFGKGITTTYNRGRFHQVKGTQAGWITYSVDWTKDRIIWSAGSQVVRTLNQAEAETNQYPQTPMRVKFGAWAGGDPNFNPAGTVEWARGPTNYSNGPFTMMVQRVVITDYSTGQVYRYTDRSGSWESIEAVGGAVNGNLKNQRLVAVPPAASSPAQTTAIASVPVGGIGRDGSSATKTQTGWPWVPGSSPTGRAIPSGWFMRPDGKIMRSSAAAASAAAPASPPLVSAASLLAVFLLAVPSLSCRLA